MIFIQDELTRVFLQSRYTKQKYELFMKAFKFLTPGLLIICTLLGCAVNDYEYISVGPKAKLVFYTPSFRNSFMANTFANLSINRMKNSCQVHLGRIGIDRKHLSREVYIPADELITTTLVFRHSVVGNGFAEEYIEHLAFTPKANRKYSVKFVDSKPTPSVHVYESSNEEIGSEVEVYPWEPCIL